MTTNRFSHGRVPTAIGVAEMLGGAALARLDILLTLSEFALELGGQKFGKNRVGPVR